MPKFNSLKAKKWQIHNEKWQIHNERWEIHNEKWQIHNEVKQKMRKLSTEKVTNSQRKVRDSQWNVRNSEHKSDKFFLILRFYVIMAYCEFVTFCAPWRKNPLPNLQHPFLLPSKPQAIRGHLRLTTRPPFPCRGKSSWWKWMAITLNATASCIPF